LGPILAGSASISHQTPTVHLTSDVRTMFDTVRAARMCDLTASVPCCLFFLPWLNICSVIDTCTDLEGSNVLAHDNERSSRFVLHHLSCKSVNGFARLKAACVGLLKRAYRSTYQSLHIEESVRASLRSDAAQHSCCDFLLPKTYALPCCRRRPPWVSQHQFERVKRIRDLRSSDGEDAGPWVWRGSGGTARQLGRVESLFGFDISSLGGEISGARATRCSTRFLATLDRRWHSCLPARCSPAPQHPARSRLRSSHTWTLSTPAGPVPRSALRLQLRPLAVLRPLAPPSRMRTNERAQHAS
jgi:hypothetical protein